MEDTMKYLQFTKVLLCRVKVHYRQVGALCVAHSVGVRLVGRVSCCHGNIHPLLQERQVSLMQVNEDTVVLERGPENVLQKIK